MVDNFSNLMSLLVFPLYQILRYLGPLLTRNHKRNLHSWSGHFTLGIAIQRLVNRRSEVKSLEVIDNVKYSNDNCFYCSFVWSNLYSDCLILL